MKAYATFAALYMCLLLTASCTKEALVAPAENAPALEQITATGLNATTPTANPDGGDSGPPSGNTSTTPGGSDVDMARIWITPEGNFVTE